MSKRKLVIQRLRTPKNATLAQKYAILRKNFSAADLQKFTEIEPMIPADQVLAGLEAIHREETRKKRKK
jgi:hypothetical protein